MTIELTVIAAIGLAGFLYYTARMQAYKAEMRRLDAESKIEQDKIRARMTRNRERW